MVQRLAAAALLVSPLAFRGYRRSLAKAFVPRYSPGVQDKQQDDGGATAGSRMVERAREVLSDLIEGPLDSGLYIVATPIGNLGDISLRALAVLARADLIAAEDTRHSLKLLTHFGIGAELTSYHEHNAARERPRLLSRIRAGFAIALISDAGTPLISDPGYKLVREALDAGLKVTSLPGSSAALAALTSVGLPTDTFLFAGFLPVKSGPRRSRLAELKPVPATLLLFESASRLAKSLADMAFVLGPREAAVAKELTKLHETVTRGRLDTLAATLGRELKGELVVVIAPPGPGEGELSDEAVMAALEQTLETESFRDAVRSVAERLQVKRSRVYGLGLALDRARRDEG
jgi:16S rRNA (cytidine1402-2'-O)-methyltransferase